MNLFANKLLIIGLCLLALLSGYAVARLNSSASAPQVVENATKLNAPRPLPQFSLIDDSGQPFTNENLLNKWSILFFGFTNCPDVCPTTLAVLKDTYIRILERDPSVAPQIYLITVDPQRDTPAKLAAYVHFFHPDFIGLTGTEAALDEFTKTVGIARNQVPLEDGSYTVDHTSALFFVDPRGRTAAISSSPHLPAVIANDFLAIATDYSHQ